MRFLLGLLFSLSVAAIVGLGATLLTLQRGTAFGAFTIGAWTSFPRNGSLEIDPYARANVARSGALPIGSGDGIAFFASTDDAGKALDGRCDVTVSGKTPQARYFTVTLYDSDGRLVANTPNRYGFTSQEIIRKTDGTFDISIAPRARTGNWLPTGAVERYVLALRLYDTPVGVATRTGRETPMPAITTGNCP
ncbi:MAG TPA: DUF1214 domain-containing protein [Pseudorhodoplanes sp.]|nr:DUF1214 domain-containing protein [Pseudorhodoplanes sp.]